MIRHKLAIAALAAACLMFPAVVHADCTRCCGSSQVVSFLNFTPSTAEEGQPISFTIEVISCGSAPLVFRAGVNLTPTNSACAPFADGFAVSGIIRQGYRFFTYTLPAPNCDSAYKVNYNGRFRGTLTVN
jgi:hypothetical protein